MPTYGYVGIVERVCVSKASASTTQLRILLTNESPMAIYTPGERKRERERLHPPENKNVLFRCRSLREVHCCAMIKIYEIGKVFLI